MATFNSANQRMQNTRTEKFARALLATTCLTVVSGAGARGATIVNEGQGSAPSDFPEASPGYLVPVGTTQVNGTVSSGSDNDWFEFQGLLPSSPFTVTSLLNYNESGIYAVTFDSAQTNLGFLDIGESCCNVPHSVTGVVPADGLLEIHAYSYPFNNTPRSYQISLDAQTGTPEPATGGITAAAGLALASALAWRRRRSS